MICILILHVNKNNLVVLSHLQTEGMVNIMDTSPRLSGLERVLLVLPLAAGIVFGLFPLLVPQSFATFMGYTGNDPFIYRLAGAATFGYAVALALGLWQGIWAAVRLLVIVVFTFNLASLYACAFELINPSTNGGARPIVYLILATSIVFVAMTGILLYRHRKDVKLVPDIAQWVMTFIVIATVLAAAFGLTPLFYPQINHLFGFKVTDLFLYRQAGAATLGYAVMGVFELRSRNWQEIRSPNVMAGVFNGLSFLAALLTIALGESLLLPAVVAVAALAVTVAAIVVERTHGGTSTGALATPSA
jgi:hypothetical protein